MFALSEFDVCNVDCASFTWEKFTLQCKAHLQHYDFSFSSIQLQIAFKSPVFNCSSLHALLCPDFFKIMILPPRPMLVVYALHLWVQLCKLWGLCNVRCKTAHSLLYSGITCVCQCRNALNIWKQYILKFRQICTSYTLDKCNIRQRCTVGVCYAEAAPVARCQPVGGSRSHKNMDEQTCA